MNNIALAIKSYISETGRTQSFVSKKTGIPPSQLNLSLNSKRKMTIDEYERICRALGVPASTFLDDEPPQAS